MLKMISFRLKFVLGMFNYLFDLFVCTKLLHMVASALNSVSWTYKLSHLFEYFAASIFRYVFTFFFGGIVSLSEKVIRIQCTFFALILPNTQYFCNQNLVPIVSKSHCQILVHFNYLRLLNNSWKTLYQLHYLIIYFQIAFNSFFFDWELSMRQILCVFLLINLFQETV